MLIEIYSKDNCQFCEQAINRANVNDNELIVNKLGVDFNREDLLKIFPTAKTFPQIKVDGVSIGGWNEFRNMEI